MRMGSLFSSAGMFDVGFAKAGHSHAWGCEWDEWRRELWAKRFDAPCYGDIRELKGVDLEQVDCIAGGFPCRGVSSAGKRNGFEHPETALWSEFARLVRELRPGYVVVENVADLLRIKDGAVFGTVVGDLAEGGFDMWWDCIPASALSAPHRRDRAFIVAYSHGNFAELHGRSRGVAGPSGRGEGTSRQRQRNGDATPNCREETPTDSGQGRREERASIHGEESTIATGHIGGPGLQMERGAGETIADADGMARQASESRRGQVGTLAQPGAVERTQRLHGGDFDWREYEPAIRRWELALGRPAPTPLERIYGLDDGDAAMQRMRRRVDKSRMSAHGDGVLVQAGELIGRMLTQHQETIVEQIAEAA